MIAIKSPQFSTVLSSLTLTAICLALGACGNKTKAPAGQVVATVNGHEITQSELAAETGDLNPALSPAARKSFEQASLQNIVARYILADAARQAKLDKTPLAAILELRAKDLALVDLIQRKLRRDVPLPSREEARIYASDHPATFTQRRIFLVDQYVARDVPPSLLKQLDPLHTLEEVGAVLTENNVAFSKTVGVLDALNIDPDAAEQIANLPPGEVFLSPEGSIIRANRVRETEVDPILGEDAIRIAREVIQNKRSAELLDRQISGILVIGGRNVRYNPAYRPAPAPTAAKSGANVQPASAPGTRQAPVQALSPRR